MERKEEDVLSKNLLDWLTRVGAIATALATIVGVFFPGDEAKRVAFAVALLLAVGSAAVFYYQRRRAARYKIAEALEPLAPSAALRGLRYSEWTRDPDPTANTFVIDFAYLLRDARERVRVVQDRHALGLFARAEQVLLMREVGFEPRVVADDWKREVFVGVRAGD